MTDPNHIAEARKKVSRPQIREVFLRNGAVISADRDDLPDYVHESVFELLEMAAPAVQGEPDVSALVEALEKYEYAFEELFAQCCSNPITNAWGKPVSVVALNDAHAFASSRLATLRKGGDA